VAYEATSRERSLTTWLHRIATNVALRMLEQRRPVESLDAHLQPYPDRFLDELPSPEEQAITRERLGLALSPASQASRTISKCSCTWVFRRGLRRDKASRSSDRWGNRSPAAAQGDRELPA
jgi:hypothetical protein